MVQTDVEALHVSSIQRLWADDEPETHRDKTRKRTSSSSSSTWEDRSSAAGGAGLLLGLWKRWRKLEETCQVVSDALKAVVLVHTENRAARCISPVWWSTWKTSWASLKWTHMHKNSHFISDTVNKRLSMFKKESSIHHSTVKAHNVQLNRMKMMLLCLAVTLILSELPASCCLLQYRTSMTNPQRGVFPSVSSDDKWAAAEETSWQWTVCELSSTVTRAASSGVM